MALKELEVKYAGKRDRDYKLSDGGGLSRRNRSPAFKAKVALAAVKGDKTLADPAQQYDVHPNLIDQWRARLLEGAADVFGASPAPAEPTIDVTVLHAKIGELTLASDVLAGALGKAGLLPSSRR